MNKCDLCKQYEFESSIKNLFGLEFIYMQFLNIEYS